MIVISVVDYNSASKTYEYIVHCSEKFDNAAFIVVDNSCNEKNYNQLISNLCKKELINYVGYDGVCGTDINGATIAIIKNNENNGYGNGNNIAFFIAKQLWKFDYFVVSNNDLTIMNTHISESFIQKAFDDDDIGLVGPEIINIEGIRQSPNRKCGIMHRWFWPLFLYPVKYDATDLELTTKKFVYYVNGSFMIFKRDAFEKCGGFDSKTFLYAEEPIVAERLSRIGLKVRYFPNIHIKHNHSAVISKYYDILKKSKLRYTSDRYYFKEYRKINNFVLILCDVNFYVFSLKFRLIRKIRGIIG